jgi:hypothetical protein
VVNVLPHTKFDTFENECRAVFGTMLSTVNPGDCPCWMLAKQGPDLQSEDDDLQMEEDEIDDLFVACLPEVNN